MNITLLQIVIEANGVALGGFGNSAHAQQWLGKKAAAAALALALNLRVRGLIITLTTKSLNWLAWQMASPASC